VFANIELKSITAQRLMIVFSVMAQDLAQCLISKEITNKSFLNKLKSLSLSLICPNRKHRPTFLEKIAMIGV